MSLDFALHLTQRFLAFSILLQNIEMFFIRKEFQPNGVFQWGILRNDFKEFPKLLRIFFDRLMNYPNFLGVLALQFILSINLFFFSDFMTISLLFAVTLIISLRWRGSFNGGSDSMTLLVLGALVIAITFKNHPKAPIASLWYIAIQSSFSYFIGGFVKIKESSWWNGKALKDFLRSSQYLIPETIKALCAHKGLLILLSWTIMLFEILFPFILFFTHFKMEILFIGAIFHALNIYLFGLNRFFYAWVATYPALYYCSNSI
ncbi:MAG: HTTM domain-containing protein [Proteobacteria bacterium]|nr:HTTM domain-containing protein [Pseudomonadota bacterium]